MGVDPNSRPVLKAIDTYFDDLSDLQQMKLVSKLLNAQTDSTPRVQQKLGFYLSYTNFSKIKKLLDLLEYLTFMSPSKLPEIINGEKFVENYSSALMEPEIQEQMLNLLRLWSDKFENNKNEINRMCELAENLANFGIDIPQVYTSKYENIANEAANADETKPDTEAAKPETGKYQQAEVAALSVKAQSLREQAGLLINDSNFLRLPKIAREENAQELIEDISSLIVEFSNVLESGFGAAVNDMIQGTIDELKKYHSKIREAVDQSSSMDCEDNDVGIYGPHLPGYPGYPGHAGYEDHFPSMMDKNGFLIEKSVSSDKENINKFNNSPNRTYVTDIQRSDMEANIYRHLPASLIIPIPAYSSQVAREIQNPSPNHRSKPVDDSPPKDNDVRLDRPLDKELCSKLVIRKKFVSPTDLTHSLNNPCFSGIPLFVKPVPEDQGNHL